MPVYLTADLLSLDAPSVPSGWRGLIDFGESWNEADAHLWYPTADDAPIGQPLVYGCSATREGDQPNRVTITLFALDERRAVMQPGAKFILREGRTARANGVIVK